MVLRLRLARVPGPGGAKRHRPIYNIVLAQARSARDSKPMEVLGMYDPVPKETPGAKEGDRKTKEIKVDVSRAKYWLGVGAQPSNTVWRLLAMIGLVEPRYLPTGQQTHNALKAVRFPVHQNAGTSGKTRGEKAAASKSMKGNTMVGKGEIGAGTTSPMNPNEA